MITKNDLNVLFEWAKNFKFPLRSAPTSDNYSNKLIPFCWLKNTMKYSLIREKLINNQNICNILTNSDILFAGVLVFNSETKLGPHRDPNIYSEPYKRIQIPLEIPDKNKCYMIWKGEKVFWQEGISQVYEVMDYIHEGYNLSDKPMKFLFLDVKKTTIIV